MYVPQHTPTTKQPANQHPKSPKPQCNSHQFLPHYRFNHRTGEWRHHSRFTRFPSRRWLSSFDFERVPITTKVSAFIYLFTCVFVFG